MLTSFDLQVSYQPHEYRSSSIETSSHCYVTLHLGLSWMLMGELVLALSYWLYCRVCAFVWILLKSMKIWRGIGTTEILWSLVEPAGLMWRAYAIMVCKLMNSPSFQKAKESQYERRIWPPTKKSWTIPCPVLLSIHMKQSKTEPFRYGTFMYARTKTTLSFSRRQWTTTSFFTQPVSVAFVIIPCITQSQSVHTWLIGQWL